MMKKRLIAFVEVLMAMSVFCTGYAAWSYVSPYSRDALFTVDLFEAYDVTNAQLTPADYGVELLTANSSGTLQAQTFRYHIVTVNGTATEQFVSTTLSILLSVDLDKMANADTDYRLESLVVTCEVSATGADFGASSIGYWLTVPEQATLKVDGYPNVSRTVSLSLVNGKLEAVIPLTELYNLLLPCKAPTTPFMELEIAFAPTGQAGDFFPISVPCSYQYGFSGILRL